MMLWQDWVNQPQQPVGLSQTWRQRGFVGAFLGNGLWVDSSGAFKPLTNSAAPVYRPAPKLGITSGLGSTFGSGTTHYQSGVSIPYPRSGFRSIVAHVYTNGAGGGGLGRVFQPASGTGAVTAGDEGIWLASGHLTYNRMDSAASWAQHGATSFPTGRWACLGVTSTFATTTAPLLYVDGIASSVTTINAGGGGSTAQVYLPITFGNRSSDSARSWDGLLGPVLFFDGQLSQDEHLELAQNPWQIFAPIERAIWVNVAASGAYTLTADNAAWQFAAQNAGLRTSRKLTAENAPWNFAAQDASLRVARKLTADSAPWEFAAQSAGLTVARKIAGDNAAWEFAAQSAGLTVARKIAGDNAAWEFAAQDATLTYTPATGAYTLTAESAAWQFAVPDATLNYSPIGGQSGGGGWLPSLPTKEERDEYVRRQREALGIIPKRIQPVAKVIKRISKQAAKRGIEPTVEQVREVAPFRPVDTQPIADALAINFRIYLALLERDRREREKTRQFIAEQIEQAKTNAIALEASLRLQEEEEVFVVMSLLLAD